ncbi:MAG: hypothetical protein IVW55_18375 [Chloroflexi bacterium]|nr:hypothetical protein [Chloroflexota bacterium]
MTLRTEVKEKIDYAPLPADVYEARLVDIKDGDGKYGLYWLWKFEVPEVEQPDGGPWQSWKTVFSGVDIRPESGDRRPPRAIAEALEGRKLADDEYLTTEEYEDLVGKNCRLSLSIVLGKDNVWYNQVDSVLPLKRGGADGRQSSAQAPTPITPDLKLAEKELYIARYEKAKRGLGWDNTTLKEWIASITEQTKPFALLEPALQLYVVETMEAEMEAGDIPFESPDELFPDEAEKPAKAGIASARARGGGAS